MFRARKTLLLGVALLPVGLMALWPLAGREGPQPSRWGEIDRHVRELMRRQRIPGLALALVQGGQVVRARGYGMANVEHGVPARPQTVFQAGSLGKQLTAAAVLLLVQDGKLSLDAPITRYLKGCPPSWKDVTVRHLLNHTSCIKEYTRKDVDRRRDHTDEQLLAIFAGFPLDFPPGTRFRYCDTGYVLLGMLITRVAGEPHGAFLRRRILGPLGMDSTRVISEEDIVPNRAAGYRLLKRQLKNQEWVAPSLNTLADGCLYTTVLDLAKWDAALDTEKVLKNPLLQQMWAPARLAGGKTHPYGFGWKLRTLNGHRLFEHRGTWQGFRAYIGRYPDDRLTVIVLTNLATSSPERIGKEVAGLYQPELTPAAPKPLSDPEPQVAGRLRAALGALAAGKLGPDQFTLEARREFFPVEAEEWQEVLANVGPLGSLALVERKRAGASWHCRYVADFGEVTADVGFRLSEGGKIAELDLYQY
jgi:CubicO group peptidase (beta-lactamase class C family)